MKNVRTNPTLVKGVKELDRLANSWYKSRDEKSYAQWFQLIHRLASHLRRASEEE